jgi:hypothetical protein
MKDSFWIQTSAAPGSEALFRGKFRLTRDGRVRLCMVGASCYQAWINGQWLLEGPFRYPLEAPEFQSEEIDLPAGDHVLSVHARHDGVTTRMLKATPPFLWCRLLENDREIPIAWKGLPLAWQSTTVSWLPAPALRRINPQLGWSEQRDTRLEPEDWREAIFDDAAWVTPVMGASDLPEPKPARLSPVPLFTHELAPMAEGLLASTFGLPDDDPSYAFFVRDRACRDLPARGRWLLYDLGRVRLGRPSIALDVPAGTVIEMASAEALTDGRVSPCIPMSSGPSCNLDRFIARGGQQTFTPLVPKGGRFLEVHVLGEEKQPRALHGRFFERCYHAPTDAEFACGDTLLEKIWQAGAETHRACTEDALTDNPTRERGQWTGDAAATGIDNAAVLYHDQQLYRRSLVHAALCAREDGLVAAVTPGGCYHMSTYAFLWVAAVCKYHRFTGDHSLLEELWPAAVRNMQALEPFFGHQGLRNEAGQIFIDWGYRTEEPADTATNLLLLLALRDMSSWATQIGQDGARYKERAATLEATLRTRLQAKLASGGWSNLGYHSAALALLLGLIKDEISCLDYIASHLRDCFPNNLDAPRNEDPLTFNARLITPYFAHFVFPLFFERGRADFVLDQYRTCWGWLLGDGRTTLPEVFDTRWSHCHQWSGCPTWQMSRYLLGLRPRLDLGPDTFEFCLAPGSLSGARGQLPHPAGGWIDIEWRLNDGALDYSCHTDAKLAIRFTDGTVREIAPRDHATCSFRPPPSRIL